MQYRNSRVYRGVIIRKQQINLFFQIAGLLGCEKVIGICETEEKCTYITDELGVTAAINTSNQDVASRLKELAPSGVNIFIDNCGGDLSDSIILQVVATECNEIN